MIGSCGETSETRAALLHLGVVGLYLLMIVWRGHSTLVHWRRRA